MRNRLVIYAVLFGAYIGVSLPLPLMGPLIMSSESPFALAATETYFYLSLVLAAFPLGNLIGAPVVGFISDRIGHKQVLMAGLFGGALFYALSGIAIELGNISLLIISRFFSGVCEGNAAIAQSHLAHGADPETKPRLFGMMIAVISVGYVAGPLVGGIFTNTTIFSFASPALPFYVVAVFLALTLAMVQIFFVSNVRQGERHSFLDGLKTLLHNTTFVRLIILALILAMGRSLYIDFLASFLTVRFGSTSESTTWLWVLLAAIWGIAALFTDLGKTLVSYQMKMILACALAAVMVLLMTPFHSMPLFTLLSSCMVVGLAMSGTINAVFVSDHAPPSHLGLAMGLLSSTYLLGEVGACLLGGKLLRIHDATPFFVSGVLLSIVTIGFFALFFVGKKRTSRTSPLKTARG